MHALPSFHLRGPLPGALPLQAVYTTKVSPVQALESSSAAETASGRRPASELVLQ